jgi:hypothetical protein
MAAAIAQGRGGDALRDQGGLSNSEMAASIAAGPAQGAEDQGPRWSGILRGAKEIQESGALDFFKKKRGIKVRESEGVRTVDDDATLVQQDLSYMSAEQIADLKKQAMEAPELEEEREEAIRMRHFGSKKHRQYGELVEKLTGGVISAEEAMAMNPTGGIPGEGAKALPIVGHIQTIQRHAMRHDATGFLKNKLDVGPGYGTKTSAIGRKSTDPLAGQWLGVLREMGTPSKLPDGETAAKPGRFK